MKHLLVCALALLAAPAWAGNYLDTSLPDPTAIASPLPEGSDAWKADIATIVSLQKSVTPEVLKKAESEVHMAPEMVASVLGTAITRKNNPKLFLLLDRVAEDGKTINHRIKDYWNTRRPYLASPQVKALITPHQNPAYPSGHTSGSLIWAEVLAQVFPEMREALLARAAEIAQHRVLTGMHYPHDVDGGRALAALIMKALAESDAFQRDLAEVRLEVGVR